MSAGAESYTDGDINPRPAGVVIIGKQVNNSLKALSLDASGSLQVNVVTSSAPSVSLLPANNNWGQSIAVTSGSTSTIISIASSISGYQLRGFIVHGTGDGYWTVQVASTTVYSGRTRSTLPSLVIALPNGVAVTTGSLVTLRVTNESGSTADYEATLLGN